MFTLPRVTLSAREHKQTKKHLDAQQRHEYRSQPIVNMHYLGGRGAVHLPSPPQVPQIALVLSRAPASAFTPLRPKSLPGRGRALAAGEHLCTQGRQKKSGIPRASYRGCHGQPIAKQIQHRNTHPAPPNTRHKTDKVNTYTTPQKHAPRNRQKQTSSRLFLASF